jgi:glycosyltransferase involved in cell wall biosynthesis
VEARGSDVPGSRPTAARPTPIACLFGTYDRGHSANRLLRDALAHAGFRVVECHEPLWEETHDKGARYFAPASLGRLAGRWAGAAVRLRRRFRALAADTPPLVVTGFGGQLDVLLARRVCRPRAGLVFAPLVTLAETLVDDRAVVAAGGPAARALRTLDRATLGAADLVLVDTAAHAGHFRTLGARRVGVWHLGAEPEFLAAGAGVPVPRRVLFTGRFLPLHGIDTIVEAARRLGTRADVTLLGTGPERPRIAARVAASGAPIAFRDDVPLAALPGELQQAAVVLGVFGTSEKAATVVPNKVYQAAAVGRPLVTRDGPALREVLQPGEDCIAIPPGDPAALADAILRLLDDPEAAAAMGRSARARVLERFAPGRQGAALAALLRQHLGVAADPEPAGARGAG